MSEAGLAETRLWLAKFTHSFERHVANPDPSAFWRQTNLETDSDFALDLRRQADDYTQVSPIIPVWEAERAAAVAAGQADPVEPVRTGIELGMARLRFMEAEAELDFLRLIGKSGSEDHQKVARRLLAIRDGIDEYTKLAEYIPDWRLLNAERQRDRAESARESEARAAS